MDKPLKIGSVELANSTVMAPMCGISDSPWRRMARRFGASLVFTEMVSSEALIREKERSFELLAYTPQEKPLVMQLCGSDATVLAEAAKICEGLGAAIVDLNMGCPVKKIVSQGAGSALLLDLPRVAKILSAMVTAVKIPVTLKIRAGWDERHPVALEVAQIAAAEGIAGLSVHARTRAQGFSGQADWRIIAAVVAGTRLPVIGNGDVNSREAAARMFHETGCAGVMLGRGAQGRPWIFRELKDPEYSIPDAERHAVIREHFETACAFYGKERGVRLMRKHLAWYSHGLPGGPAFRDEVMRLHDAEAVLRHVDGFFGAAMTTENSIQSIETASL